MTKGLGFFVILFWTCAVSAFAQVPVKVGLVDLDVGDDTLNNLNVADVKRMTFWSKGLEPARYQYDVQSVGHGDRMAEVLVDTIHHIMPDAAIELFVATPIQEDPAGRLILDPNQLRFAYEWMGAQGVSIVAQTFVAADSPSQRAVYQRIQELGMVVFASAGNGPIENVVPPYPASFPDVIGISTTALRDQLRVEQNRHAYTDYSVPAPEISDRRIRRNPNLALDIGSSSATVKAAGILVGIARDAVVRSVSAARVLLDQFAVPREQWPGRDAYGRGVLDPDLIRTLLLGPEPEDRLKAG